MSDRTLDPQLRESLSDRFRQRLETGLTLARAHRFVEELEPSSSEESDAFADLAVAFRTWRRALRSQDAGACLDAMEITWSRLEVFRRRLEKRDAVIEAFRLRWAGENAALSYQTIGALARFYRLLPLSTSSQSKYEYVLTRRLAGPLVPDRRLPPTVDLLDAVEALETSWGATPLRVGDSEVATISRVIRSFGQEASQQEDAAAFIAGALLRRFGAFKASLGEKLFDPRVSVVVVETNVRVFNVLNQLLTDAGGRPLRGTAAIERPTLPVSVRLRSPEAAPLGDSETEPERAGGALRVRSRPRFLTSEIDISGLELVRRQALTPAPAASAEGPAPQPEAAPAEAASETPAPQSPFEPETPPRKARPEVRSGEVDLSGLDFVRRVRYPAGPSPAPAPLQEPLLKPAPPQANLDVAGAGPHEDSAVRHAAEERPGPSASESGAAGAPEAEQLPSSRAFELRKIEENTAIIEQYLTKPRSPEVWRLNLDNFLCPSDGEVAETQKHRAERRRAFGLILASDDLICLRESEGGAPTQEHRARVKDLAQSMLRLQTFLRRAAGLPQGPLEVEPLLYVSDHLLWERLRLSASLTRRPTKKRPPLLPRVPREPDRGRGHPRSLRRDRVILVGSISAAAILTVAISMLGISAPRPSIDPEVVLLRIGDLPVPQIFEDARAFRNRLFVTADLSWKRLGREERQAIVRSVAAFASARGFDTVSIVGNRGEALATFKDSEVLLASDLVAPPGNEP